MCKQDMNHGIYMNGWEESTLECVLRASPSGLDTAVEPPCYSDTPLAQNLPMSSVSHLTVAGCSILLPRRSSLLALNPTYMLTSLKCISPALTSLNSSLISSCLPVVSTWVSNWHLKTNMSKTPFSTHSYPRLSHWQPHPLSCSDQNFGGALDPSLSHCMSNPCSNPVDANFSICPESARLSLVEPRGHHPPSLRWPVAVTSLVFQCLPQMVSKLPERPFKA